MSDLYYQKLKNLVDNARLQTYIIIAPPRSNSSLVEHSLGNSPDIEHECHEPFLNARHENFDPDHGYKQIYESIGGEQFAQSDSQTSVVIKEMSHWIGKNEEYKRLSTLTTKPIVFLIRNPSLTVESRLRRVLKTIDMRYSIDLQRHLLDEVAVERGFQNWNDLSEIVKEGGYKERLDFLPGKEGVERIYDTPVLTVQNHLLNLKARKDGYANWQDVLEKKLYTERDYAWFSGILKSNTRRLGFERDEFRKLSEEVKYFEDQKRENLVFDTTDLRAAPEEQMQELCSRLGINFSPEMIRWGEKPVDFHTEQVKQSERLWYDTLYSSSRVNPPTEIPPSLDSFPEFMQEYLRTENLPIYAEISKKKILRNELRHELNEREFSVKVTDADKERLRELGLIEDGTKIGERISVKMKYIDPVYAISNEPKLIEQSEFQIFRNKYRDEIKIISDIVSEGDEHTREIKKQNGEIKFR
jgi:hypothetical protein